MAAVQFLASLINTGLTPPAPSMVLSADCLTIAVTDESNYGATTQVGYTPNSKFADYRKVIITHQSGKIFTMSSQPGGDQLITAAAVTANATFTYTKKFGDGVYAFNLITVPTWNGTDDYQNSFPPSVDCVFNPTDKLLYKNIVAAHAHNQNHQPDLSPAYWVVIPDAQLPSQFSVTEKISVLCDANVCYMKKNTLANCTIGDDMCDDDMICNNKNFLDSLKIASLIDGVVWASNKGDFDLAVTYFNSLSAICNC